MANPAFLKPPGEVAVLETRTLSAKGEARDGLLAQFDLPTQKLLRGVMETSKMLHDGMEPVRMHDDTVTLVPLGRDRISSLKAAQDAYFRLLNKVMPDMQRVVVTDENGDKVPFSFSMILE